MHPIIYEPDVRVLSGFKIFTTLAAAIVMLASLMVLSAWTFDIVQLKELFPALETTKPLGAMGFLMTGVALLMLRSEEDKTQPWKYFLGITFASLAFLIGSLVLLEYGLKIDFGIDLLLFREAIIAQGGSFPGRPILAVSVWLTIIGLALIFIRSKMIWFDLLVFVVFVGGLVALTNYVYNSTAILSVNTYQSLPLPSVVVMIILAMGYLSARPKSRLLTPITSSRVGGIIARRIFPVMVLFPLGLVGLRFIIQGIGPYHEEFDETLFASAYMIVLSILVYWSAQKLNETDMQRDAVQATLEQRVTERTQQVELERSRWQGIVQGIADEVWSCNTQGKMSLLNLATVTAMGLDAFKDKSVEEIYQEVDIFYPNGQPRPMEQAPLLLSLRGDTVRGEEIMRHRQTGQTRYRQFSSAPLYNAIGTITGAVAIVRDITEQKHAEEGLHRFELLSEYSKDIVLFMRREDGRILEANRAAQHAYGYSRDELLSLTIPKLRARGTNELTGDQILKTDQEGILFETIHRRKDGTTFPVEISSQGAVIGGILTRINIVRDITERKLAEDALRKSETRYHMLFTSIDEGYCVIRVLFDEAGKPHDYVFEEINPAFERQTDIQNAEGRSMREIAPNHEAYWFETYGRIAITGQPERFENIARELHRWYDVYAFRIGEPEERRVAILFNDITERKRAAEQLTSALREKEVLLKEIHHRVKNNLQVISSLLRLQSEKSNAPQIRELFADSQRRVHAMALIHEQLYQSSSLANINLKEYIHKLVHHLRRSYAQESSNLEIIITVENINIEIGQAVPLGLMVSELVSNSLKYAFSSKGLEQTGKVWISVQRKASAGLVVIVGDDGLGISENLDLEQLPTMGLQLVRSFVTQLGGQLTIQRNPGTIFTVTIPDKEI